MADAELLLTINGADVTADVWQWSSVQLTDAWTAHPTLSFTLRQAWGSVTTVAGYDDVRLTNLLTGVVLFEGIVAPGNLEQAETDPTWVVTDVSCVGYQVLFDSSMLQSELTVYEDPSEPGVLTVMPDAAVLLSELVRLSFADARCPITVTSVPYTGFPLVRWWGLVDLTPSGTGPYTFAQWSSLAALIREVMDRTNPTAAGGWSASNVHPYVAKLIPGMGLVLTAPDVAVRGTAPVTLNAANYGVPARASAVADSSGTASAVLYSVSMYSPPVTNRFVRKSLLWGDEYTNGYIVIRDALPDGDYPGTYFLVGNGADASFYRVISPQMPHDVLVGHEITFGTARLGNITGTVQSISTTFADGLYDQTSAAWPYFLDAGRSFDGTWNLDASNSSVIPRRMRTTTMTVSATASPGVPGGKGGGFVQRLRRTHSLD